MSELISKPLSRFEVGYYDIGRSYDHDYLEERLNYTCRNKMSGWLLETPYPWTVDPVGWDGTCIIRDKNGKPVANTKSSHELIVNAPQAIDDLKFCITVLLNELNFCLYYIGESGVHEESVLERLNYISTIYLSITSFEDELEQYKKKVDVDD